MTDIDMLIERIDREVVRVEAGLARLADAVVPVGGGLPAEVFQMHKHLARLEAAIARFEAGAAEPERSLDDVRAELESGLAQLKTRLAQAKAEPRGGSVPL